MIDNKIRAIAAAAARKELARTFPDKGSAFLSTTDATATVILSLPIKKYESGIIEYTIMAMKNDGANGITAKKIFKYKYDSTTLTIGTEASILALVTDVTGATASANVNGSAIEIKVTGAASTTIFWTAYYNRRYLNVAALLP